MQTFEFGGVEKSGKKFTRVFFLAFSLVCERNLNARDHLINFRVCFIVPQSVDAVEQWDVSRLLHGRSWVRSQVGVDEDKFIVFSFGKIGSLKDNSDFLFQFSN